jgi:RimJ/RimL family protein N-acetyltransferase
MRPIYLRALELTDLERTHRWHNDQAMYTTMGSTFHYVSLATEEAWLRQIDINSQQQVNLAICVTETSQHIGNIYLRDIDWVARHASVHIFIGEPRERSNGYGYTAVTLLTKHAFADLGLRRLHLLALTDNISVELFKKCGYIVEGVLRQHTFVDGRFRDLVVMARCAEQKPIGSTWPLRDQQERTGRGWQSQEMV